MRSRGERWRLTGQCGDFRCVHLEGHGREFAQASAAIRQHEQAGKLLLRGVRGLAHERRHDAGLRLIDLIHEDDGVDPWCKRRDARREGALQ